MGDHLWKEVFVPNDDTSTKVQKGHVPSYEGDPSDSNPSSLSDHQDEEDSKEEDPAAAEKEEFPDDDVNNNADFEEEEEDNSW